MGSSDVAPAHAPPWLVPLSTVLLAGGVSLWCLTYVLMTRRSLATRSYGMPIVGLAINVAWEVVYGFYVAEAWFEKTGFIVWLLLDGGLLYTTVRFAPVEWRATSPFVGRHMAWILFAMFAVSIWGHWAFADWWLGAGPGFGTGDKTGKWWRGADGYDTTELAFWSAGVSQSTLSVGSLAMLIVRGHSGGTGYAIWAARFLGSLCGMVFCNGVLWWYWPEAHSYFVSPPAIFINGLFVICDMVYPLVLWRVRQTEKSLPDGRLVRQDAGQLESKPKAM